MHLISWWFRGFPGSKGIIHILTGAQAPFFSWAFTAMPVPSILLCLLFIVTFLLTSSLTSQGIPPEYPLLKVLNKERVMSLPPHHWYDCAINLGLHRKRIFLLSVINSVISVNPVEYIIILLLFVWFSLTVNAYVVREETTANKQRAHLPPPDKYCTSLGQNTSHLHLKNRHRTTLNNFCSFGEKSTGHRWNETEVRVS